MSKLRGPDPEREPNNFENNSKIWSLLFGFLLVGLGLVNLLYSNQLISANYNMPDAGPVPYYLYCFVIGPVFLYFGFKNNK